MAKELSWKPKLIGKQYCAPACGRGCTKSEYDRAVTLSNELVSRMKGKGWKPRVWENLGWHYEVYNGYISVHPGILDDNKYWCLLSNEKGGHGGLAMWTPQKNTHKDPNVVVRKQIIYTKAVLKRLQEPITYLEGVLKEETNRNLFFGM